jgi:hypothetical protein
MGLRHLPLTKPNILQRKKDTRKCTNRLASYVRSALVLPAMAGSRPYLAHGRDL